MTPTYRIIKNHFNYFAIAGMLICAAMRLEAQDPRNYLQKALAANGPWQQLYSFYFSTDRSNTNPWQSYSFSKPLPAKNKLELYMDLTQGTYQLHTVFTYPGGYVFDLVNIGKDSTRWLYDKNQARNGRTIVKQGKDAYTANRNSAVQSIPFFTVKTLLETRDSLEYNQGTNEILIKRVPINGSAVEYSFDRQTNLLKKVIRVAQGKKFESQYGLYKTFDGLKVPSTIKQLVDGEINSTELLTAFKPNVKIQDAIFNIPVGYKIAKTQTAKPLSAKTIAKDIYLIEGVGGDRNIVFINMKDFVIVTEAPYSSDVTKSMLDVIHKKLPGKPVRYMHLSHHHNDHSGGLRQMAFEGATIVCAKPLEPAMKALLSGALQPGADDFSKAPKEAAFEFIDGVKVIEDGEHRVEFHTVTNTHAEGLSFMYLPKEKLIYQGDFLSVPEDGTITPAIAVTKEFAAYLDKNDIKFSRIIGHHGHTFITSQMLDKALGKKIFDKSSEPISRLTSKE